MLSIVVPITSTILFIPIFETLLSIFICVDGLNVYGENYKCWINEYIFHSIISGITLVLFVLFAFLIQNTYFELKYNKNGYSSKKTLLTDNVLLYNKIIIIIAVKFVYASNATEIIIAFILICMAYLSYCYTAITPYYYYEVQKSYMLMSYMTTWTYLILFVSQLAANSRFNGNVIIFLIGNAIICLGILLSNKRIDYTLILKCSLNLTSGDEAISQIEELFSIIYPKDNDRATPLLLFGYVNNYCANSIKNNHPLQQYKDSTDKSKLVYLIIHIHSLYLAALSKFPDDVRLRIFYAIFVFDCLSKREQALIELDIAMKHRPILSFEFIIYRLRDVFENQVSASNLDTFSSEMSDLATTLTYKNLYKSFKMVINKTANQYITFWNILSNSNQTNQEDLSQLNSIGSKIKKNVDKISKLYNKMKKIKPYNQEIILDYSYFISYVLNDEDKAKAFNQLLKELSYSNSSIDESNFCHLDLNKLSLANDYCYLIFSAMVKDLGRITHISIPVCSLFGYSKEELIGQPIEKLLPEFYSKAHLNSLLKIVTSYKQKLFDETNSLHNFKINFMSSDTFAINKARYLIPFHYKGAFFPNDNGNNYFFMKIMNDASASKGNASHYVCNVLTDRQLVIQHFSANATSLLGLNSNSLNSSKEITTNIKQLHEDYINYFINNSEDNHSEKTKLELKNKLVKSKYSVHAPITWVNNNKPYVNEGYNFNSKLLEEEEQRGPIISPTTSTIRKAKAALFEDNFMLIVSDYGDFGEKEGFVFKLEPIWHFFLKDNSNPVQQTNINETRPEVKSAKSRKRLLVETDSPLSRLRVGSVESYHSNTPQLKLNKGFLPEKGKKFEYNPNTNSYYQTDQFQPNEYIKSIKQQAEKKFNKNTHPQKGASLSSSQESEASSDSSYVDSEEYTQSFQEKAIEKKIAAFTSDYDYYHVDISKIKYSIYDYTKGMVMEKATFNRLSEVEVKLSKESLEEKKEENGTDSANNTVNETKGVTATNKKSFKGLMTQKGSHKQIIKKEIKKSLKKDKLQNTILILSLLSLATFILSIIKESIFLFHYLRFIDSIQNYINLIRYSYKINRNALHSIYSMRELILVNFDSYVIPLDNYTKDEYVKMHMTNLEAFFVDNDIVFTTIMNNPIQIRPDKMKALDDEAGYSYFIKAYDNYSIGNNTDTFRSACFVVNAALEHIIHTPPDELYPTNEDVFLFVFTTMNSLWKGLLQQNEVYKLFFRLLCNDLYYQQIGVFLVLESFMFICYLTSRVGLKRVADQNDSYLAVYFAIKKEIITSSLVKCELFVFQFQTNTSKDKFHDDLNDNENEVNTQQAEEEIAFNHSPPPNTSGKDKQSNSYSASKGYCKRFQCLSKFFLGYMIIIVGSAVVMVFDGLLLGLMYNLEQSITYSITLYEGEGSIEKDTVLIFDLIRESIFDRNAVFLHSPLKDSMAKLISGVYNSLQTEKQRAAEFIQFVPYLYNHYYTNNYKSICNIVEDEAKCIENTGGSALYGLETLIMFFIEEIRTIYYTDVNLKIMNTKFNFTYNYTLYGTVDYSKYFPPNPAMKPLYDKVGPMNIFNSESHKRISYIYWYLLYPKFHFLVSTIGTQITKECETQKQFYIIAESSFMAFIVGLFFFIWFPYVHQLNLLVSVV